MLQLHLLLDIMYKTDATCHFFSFCRYIRKNKKNHIDYVEYYCNIKIQIVKNQINRILCLNIFPRLKNNLLCLWYIKVKS